MKTIGINSIRKSICDQATTGRQSAWSKGVALYALDILHTIEEESSKGYMIVTEDNKVDVARSGMTASILGSRYPFDDWKGMSWAGCFLIYNRDIAERLCTPSEMKRAERNGFFRANSREDWLDVQGRALYQAAEMIKAAIREELKNLTEAAA